MDGTGTSIIILSFISRSDWGSGIYISIIGSRGIIVGDMEFFFESRSYGAVVTEYGGSYQRLRGSPGYQNICGGIVKRTNMAPSSAATRVASTGDQILLRKGVSIVALTFFYSTACCSVADQSLLL